MDEAFHLGPPSTDFSEWKLFTFHLHGIKNSDVAKGSPADLPSFSCFGQEWKLLVYPKGTERAKNGCVSLYLRRVTEEGDFAVDWTCFGRGSDGRAIADTEHLDVYFDAETKQIGCRHFLYVNSHWAPFLGTLTLELRMRSVGVARKQSYVPNNPFSDNMRKLFMDGETSDVSFDVNGETFFGHHAVLKLCAPTLAELCKMDDRTQKVPITGIDTEIFRHMLRYVYGGKVPAAELEKHAREYIEGADKFGVTNLKLEAEAMHVAKHVLTVNNSVDTLLYADSKNLALMKEAAVTFMLENAGDVLSTASFKSIPADHEILSELFSVVAMKFKDGSKKDGCNQEMYKSMSVDDLRWELAGKNLEVDGSRATLIARLEECNGGTTNGKKRKVEEI